MQPAVMLTVQVLINCNSSDSSNFNCSGYCKIVILPFWYHKIFFMSIHLAREVSHYCMGEY